jgi:ketosteroid isomerase-like protein
VGTNTEIVIAHFERTSARDFAAVGDAYADDVTLALHLAELRGSPESPKTLTGKAAVGGWFGDGIRKSGAPVAQRGVEVCTLRDEKISHVERWRAREAAIAAFERPRHARPGLAADSADRRESSDHV